jgi:hypothetical protein
LSVTPASAVSSDGTLLDNVLQAHGGLDAWRSVKRLDAKFSARGPLFQLKHQPAGLRDVMDRSFQDTGCRSQMLEKIPSNLPRPRVFAGATTDGSVQPL